VGGEKNKKGFKGGGGGGGTWIGLI